MLDGALTWVSAGDNTFEGLEDEGRLYSILNEGQRPSDLLGGGPGRRTRINVLLPAFAEEQRVQTSEYLFLKLKLFGSSLPFVSRAGIEVGYAASSSRFLGHARGITHTCLL